MKIYPADGIVEFNQHQNPMNLSCTVRELPSQTIDPSKLKWYHNKHEINHKTNSHLLHKYPTHNQATLTLSIHRLSVNSSGLFQCIYDNGLLSRDVQIIPTSSGRCFSHACLSSSSSVFFCLSSSTRIFQIAKSKTEHIVLLVIYYSHVDHFYSTMNNSGIVRACGCVFFSLSLFLSYLILALMHVCHTVFVIFVLLRFFLCSSIPIANEDDSRRSA